MREAVYELNNQLAVILNYANFVLEDTPPTTRGATTCSRYSAQPPARSG